MDDLVTLPQTVPIACLPGNEFRRLANDGFVRGFQGMTVGGAAGPRHRKSEVCEIVGQFLDLKTAGCGLQVKNCSLSCS